jgi:hypothetical protein
MTTVKLDGMPATPEHDKARPHEAEMSTISSFIDFLESIGIHFGRYPTPCADAACERRHYRSIGSGPENFHEEVYHDQLWPVGGDGLYNEWIAQFFGIDYRAYQDEKEAVYRFVSERARPQ